MQIRVPPPPPPSAAVAPQQSWPTAPQGVPVPGAKHDPFVQMPTAPVPEHAEPAEAQMRWAPPPASVVNRRQQPPPLHEFPAQHACPDSPQAGAEASDAVTTTPSPVPPSRRADPSEPPGAGASTTIATSPAPPLELSGVAASGVVTTPPLPMTPPEPVEPPEPRLPPLLAAGPSTAGVVPLPPPQAAATSKKEKKAIETAFVFRRFVQTGFLEDFEARVFMVCPPKA